MKECQKQQANLTERTNKNNIIVTIVFLPLIATSLYPYFCMDHLNFKI